MLFLQQLHKGISTIPPIFVITTEKTSQYFQRTTLMHEGTFPTCLYLMDSKQKYSHQESNVASIELFISMREEKSGLERQRR